MGGFPTESVHDTSEKSVNEKCVFRRVLVCFSYFPLEPLNKSKSHIKKKAKKGHF